MRNDIYYTTYDNQQLPIELYYEEETKHSYPLIIFFFGGGWMNGSTDHFRPQTESLIKEGFMVALVDYRTYNKNHTTVDIAMKDAFYSLKHLSDHHNELMIDPDHVILAGGSAGGHLAISCILLNQVKHSFQIKGVGLFNGVIDTSQEGYQSLASTEQPFDPIIFSPFHHLKAGLPPLLLMQGTADTVMPYHRTVTFVENCKALGNDVTLISYPDRKHGFFNQRPTTKIEDYEDTLAHFTAFAKQHTATIH